MWPHPILYGCVWKCRVSLNPMVNDNYPYEKWLFHWEYTLFSDKPIYNHHFHSKHHWKSSQILFQSSQPSCLSLVSDDICLGVIRLFVARNSQWLGCRLRQAIQECTHPDVRDRALLYYSCCRYSASRCIVSKDRCLVLERKNVPETCIEWRPRTLTMVTYRKVYICNFTFIVLEEDCFWDDSIDPVLHCFACSSFHRKLFLAQ